MENFENANSQPASLGDFGFKVGFEVKSGDELYPVDLNQLDDRILHFIHALSDYSTWIPAMEVSVEDGTKFIDHIKRQTNGNLDNLNPLIVAEAFGAMGDGWDDEESIRLLKEAMEQEPELFEKK